VTLQQLEYFLAAVRHGSFSAAAEALRLAQPSLSEQVRRLEAELGVPLFQRAGRGVRLTEAGETLRAHAERTLAEADAARTALAAVRDLRGGTAAFGTWGASRYYEGTEIVADFRRLHPDVRVRIVGQNSSETADLVREGALECGMVALPVDDHGLDVRVVMRDEVLYASVDPGRLGEDMTLDRLAQAPLILTDASFGSEDPTRRQLTELAQRAGVRVDPVIDVEDVEPAVELAGRGFGDTILARGLLLGLGPRVPRTLGWVPFADPFYDTFAFVTRRGAPLSPATRELVRIAEERLVLRARRLERDPPRRRAPGAGARR